MGDTKNTCENSGEEKYTQHRVPSSKFHRTRNGSVVTWGHPKYGGDSDIVEQLRQLGDQKMMAVAGMFHEKKQSIWGTFHVWKPSYVLSDN